MQDMASRLERLEGRQLSSQQGTAFRDAEGWASAPVNVGLPHPGGSLLAQGRVPLPGPRGGLGVAASAGGRAYTNAMAEARSLLGEPGNGLVGQSAERPPPAGRERNVEGLIKSAVDSGGDLTLTVQLAILQQLEKMGGHKDKNAPQTLEDVLYGSQVPLEGEGSSSSTGGGFSARGAQNLLKVHRSQEQHPSAWSGLADETALRQLGSDVTGMPWSMMAYGQQKLPFTPKLEHLQRTWHLLCHFHALSRQGRHQDLDLAITQALKSVEQATLAGGNWKVAWTLTSLPDPIERSQAGLTHPAELSAAVQWVKEQNTLEELLRKSAQGGGQGKGGNSEAGGGDRKAAYNSNKKGAAPQKPVPPPTEFEFTEPMKDHLPSDQQIADVSAEMSRLRKEVAVMSDAELVTHLGGLLSARGVPKNFTRKNVGAAPKSLLLGLFTRRGLGIGKGTWARLPLLCAVHELAVRRKSPHCSHGYASIMVNANASLGRHRDEFNTGLNFVFGLPAEGQGGELWLSLDPDDGPSRIHPVGELPLDRDWCSVASTSHDLEGSALKIVSAGAAHLCAVEKEAAQAGQFDPLALGAVLPVLGQWRVFDSRRPHAVIPFVPDVPGQTRFSFTLFSPRRLHAVSDRVWHALDALGFPTGDVRAASAELEAASSHAVPKKGRSSRERGSSAVLRALAAASALGSASGECLDRCWAQALWRSPPTAYANFFMCSLGREDEISRALRPPPFEDGPADPTHQRHGLYPCGLPFWESMDCSSGLPPKSGRRLQRWRRGRRIRVMVNSAVGYMSWLSLGRPGTWATAEPHPLCARLSSCQRLMCDELVKLFSAVCRPGETYVAPGGGLSHFIEAMDIMGANRQYQGISGVDSGPSPSRPLVASEVSLPDVAAQVDLLSDAVLPPRLQSYLRSPTRLLRGDSELNGPKPRMFMDVVDWDTLAIELWEKAMIRWIPADCVPQVRGADKRAGLFGVAKSSGSNLRMIVDRRPANWSEFSLRELLLQDLEGACVSLAEFEELWRLMCLPYPGSLQDLFLGQEGEVRVTTEDCSDYFYTLCMPSHWHPHTTVGWNLPRHAIPVHQLERDVDQSVHGDTVWFAAALRVVPMGDRKAMEVAQAVHQHLHLHGKSS
eukprot:181158-Amphidinium_carterae.2